MMNNKTLHQWLWKWHFIAGILSLPFVLVLSITGAIYLFRDEVEASHIARLKHLQVQNDTSMLAYQEQWGIAQQFLDRSPDAMILPTSSDQHTEFISGRFSHKKSIYIHPYTGEVSGSFTPQDTWMYSVRKLHGELLTGKVGTKLVELVASWMIVLILTGLYIWFPTKTGQWGGVFTIRFRQGRRIFFRDFHAVTGFWISLLLLLVLAGGMPWTDVFGENFKTVQKWTNTGYPKTWNGKGLQSQPTETPLTLDQMVKTAKAQHLKGTISIGLPKQPQSTFSVSNHTFDLGQQKMLHFDQYSGDLIKAHEWSDVGVLRRGRMWVMAFHQGQFGGWNWWLMFGLAILLTLMSGSAMMAYVLRKRKGQWGIPAVPMQFRVGKGVLFLLLLLGVIFPLFGGSVLLIWGIQWGKTLLNDRSTFSTS